MSQPEQQTPPLHPALPSIGRPADASVDPLLPQAEWRGISPRYASVRRLTATISNVVFWGAAATASWVALQLPPLTGAIVAAGIAWTTWRVVRVGRWVRSWRWAERDADLCISRGLWNRQLTIVPFGRLQVVDITAGPLLRQQRLADVKLVTASMHTNAHIPGLDRADAAALRDRMIELSDARGAGL